MIKIAYTGDTPFLSGKNLMIRPIHAFKNSCNGLKMAWAEDHSFRNSVIQVGLGILIATIATWYYDLTLWIWLLLVGSLFPIVIVETINSSIEAVTDKASPERHPLAKKAKDIGSAAVLLTRIMAALCWIVAFIGHN
jgi:diacylglycerol kinase (ATP)